MWGGVGMEGGDIQLMNIIILMQQLYKCMYVHTVHTYYGFGCRLFIQPLANIPRPNRVT